MAQEEIEQLAARDAGFTSRLSRRDQSVLAEIDAAYSASLLKLLLRYQGPLFRYEDANDIVQDALQCVWTNFAEKAGRKSVRRFLFDQAKWRTMDLLRKRMRRAKQQERHLALASYDDVAESTTSLDRVELAEITRNESEILQSVDEIVGTMTRRQQIAFRHRFSGPNNDAWAKHLERDEGKTASYWRKASDEALKIVKTKLLDRGLMKKEGGRYEVA